MMKTKWKFSFCVECEISATIEAPTEEVARERFRIGEYGGYEIENILGETGDQYTLEKIEEFVTKIEE